MDKNSLSDSIFSAKNLSKRSFDINKSPVSSSDAKNSIIRKVSCLNRDEIENFLEFY